MGIACGTPSTYSAHIHSLAPIGLATKPLSASVDGVRSSPFASAIEEVLVLFRAPTRDVPHARLPLLV